MNYAFGHSSGPLIAKAEISRNIAKDGTAFILIATSVSPLIHRVMSGFDSFMPLPLKIFRATTEKNQQCRVKLKLEILVLVFWRQ
jgi:hypothetical protein